MCPVGTWALVPSVREEGIHDSARHAGLAEGRRELASDLYWRYRGVVKAGENEAGQRVEEE